MKMKSSSSSFSSFNSYPFSSKTQTFGCISGILRKFLGSGISPTYQSDQISESVSKLRDFDSEPLAYNGDEPGVVARLMGLDSMPRTDKTQIVSKSITRSCSMNSVDCFRRDSDQITGSHRRARSTLGLHQLPDFVELEDENFFILSFEKEKCEETREPEKSFGESKRQRSRKCKKRRKRREIQVLHRETETLLMQMDMEGKEHNGESNATFGCERLETGELKHFGEPEKSSRELKQRRMEKCNNRRKRTDNEVRQSRIKKLEDKENEGIALNAALGCEKLEDSVKRSREGKLVLTEAKSMKAKCPKEEIECGSCEDSSPVSVLDYDRFVGVRETPESANTSRRRLSPELEADEPNPETIQDDWRTTTSRWREYYGPNHDNHEAWLDICRITETEINGTNWVLGKALKHEDLEGISVDVVAHILDQLLEETIEHLASPKMKCKT